MERTYKSFMDTLNSLSKSTKWLNLIPNSLTTLLYTWRNAFFPCSYKV
jgi:hypothetical protein